MSSKILDLGCGKNKIKGSIGLDNVPLNNVDIVHDLLSVPYPLQGNSFKRIYLRNHSQKKTWQNYGYDSAWIPEGTGVGIGRLEEFCIKNPKDIKVLGILDTNGIEISSV